MKLPKTLLSLAAGSVLVASAVSAETTGIVGYVTLTVKGTGGVGTEAFNFLGAPLENAIDYQSAMTSASPNTIADTAATWTPGAFAGTHYVQILSGSNVGISATIAGNTDTVLTTVEDLSSVLSGDETFAIRAYTTIGDIFGAANEAGLGSGANAAAADEILIQNGAAFDVYYYQTGAAFGGVGWRKSGNAFVDASGTPLPFGAGVIVNRKQVSDVDVVIVGSVFDTDTVVPVENGFNWLAGGFPVDYTLAGYFGPTGGSLQSGANAAAADEILVFDAAGNFQTYYYQTGAAFGGVGYRLSGNAFVDQSGTVLAEAGRMFILNRKGAAFDQTETDPVTP